MQTEINREVIYPNGIIADAGISVKIEIGDAAVRFIQVKPDFSGAALSRS
jgi:hypothetical protein